MISVNRIVALLSLHLFSQKEQKPSDIELPFINKFMRIFEIEKPKSPEQLRLDQLRANSKRASDAVKAERNRQKLQRAQRALQALRNPGIKTAIK
jgi:hypothetical protein